MTRRPRILPFDEDGHGEPRDPSRIHREPEGCAPIWLFMMLGGAAFWAILAIAVFTDWL